MNKPPWLKTGSTGADVQGVQKTLSNNDFKQANCLLSLTRRQTSRSANLSPVTYQLHVGLRKIRADNARIK